MRQKVCISGSEFTRRRIRILLSENVLDMDLSLKSFRTLMRTESRFNTLAVSPAEARGLMQVIWQTSQRISETGGFIDMGNAQILLPEVSIALGAWYISALLNKFEQQMPLLLQPITPDHTELLLGWIASHEWRWISLSRKSSMKRQEPT